MTISELRTLYQQGRLHEAEIIHETTLPGWQVEFRDDDGALFELTDTLGCPLCFGSVEEARAHIHKVADCPIQEDHLYRFFER
ncbi:hypothetical protein [Aeromonas schubertii]|uniref:Uncharacterized protein n=1 Tax=Aeromonas schubertii TaxID=652 RepID=A0A0S2SDC3_9GAMM|nr:hypothetical protein [Aeromonas schubertii]ALP39688.1 hypothetical protein WL1483_269 [Aeromonas schubertii]KUE81230.1 hypothetical protein ATO46_13180 [Aeromonas schubertii]MBZ6068189.1 hypothetical protein [Aeromonas schubertii]MBZ6073482.1 hypothetical protein [Aeromonas schubertii]QCG49705.1 hypothetical protein E2P79_19425 [Aeromonas schubertii]